MFFRQIQKDIVKTIEIGVSAAVVSAELVVLLVGMWVFTA
jgi:hypothetical protein